MSALCRHFVNSSEAVAMKHRPDLPLLSEIELFFRPSDLLDTLATVKESILMGEGPKKRGGRASPCDSALAS